MPQNYGYVLKKNDFYVLILNLFSMKLNKYFILSCILFISCTTKQAQITKNEYGLLVITNLAQYKLTVHNDSSKRLVLLKNYVPHLITDWKYATTDNFTNQILYTNPDAYMRIEAAEALQKVAHELEKQGIGLKIFDAYRPYTITKKMWEIVPDDRYAADPSKGSGHNRGAAVDLTLYDLTTGKELAMPTPFDNFTEKAHANYANLDAAILKNRTTLITVMQQNGFKVLDTEWWHFYLPNYAKYELMDIDFRKLKMLP